jgi:hypothetical protein
LGDLITRSFRADSKNITFPWWSRLLILAVHGVENEPVHNARNNGELFLLTWEFTWKH